MTHEYKAVNKYIDPSPGEWDRDLEDWATFLTELSGQGWELVTCSIIPPTETDNAKAVSLLRRPLQAKSAW